MGMVALGSFGRNCETVLKNLTFFAMILSRFFRIIASVAFCRICVVLIWDYRDRGDCSSQEIVFFYGWSVAFCALDCED